MSRAAVTKYVVWLERYALGHDEIDRQHQRIVHILNRLYEALRNGRGGEEVEGVVNELHDYAETHLIFEEALLAEIEYPDRRPHRAQHFEWRRQARNFRRRLGEAGEDVAREVLAMARDWWLVHIQQEDRKYAPFLRRSTEAVPNRGEA